MIQADLDIDYSYNYDYNISEYSIIQMKRRKKQMFYERETIGRQIQKWAKILAVVGIVLLSLIFLVGFILILVFYAQNRLDDKTVIIMMLQLLFGSILWLVGIIISGGILFAYGVITDNSYRADENQKAIIRLMSVPPEKQADNEMDVSKF